MTDFRRAEVGPGARGLPGSCYTDEEVYRSELERIFARRWVCSGRGEQAPGEGDYFTAALGDESAVVVRGRDSALRAFFNVCRHRGSRLCEGPPGRFGRSIQCPYHGWTYGLDGRLLAARQMDGVPGFDPGEYPLHSVALAEWEGFVFLNLSPDPPPFEQVFAPLVGRFADWDLPALRAGARIEYEVSANWKLLVENYSECYHCPLAHPELTRLSPPESGRNDLREGPFLGGYMTLRHPGGSMTDSGQRCRPALGGLAAEALDRVYYYSIFPNLLLSLHPDYVMAHLLWPQGTRRTTVVCEWYFDPAVRSAPGFDPSDAVEFWDRTNRQDWRLCEQTQLGVASRAYVPGPYADAEGLLWAFDQEYRAAMEVVA
jgi:Rieske 2Fe-2S family protein